MDALFDAVGGPDRRWSPYNSETTRSEFRGRLREAARGRLRPVDHVKCLDRGEAQCLFEVRWSGVTVQEVDRRPEAGKNPDGSLKVIHVDVEARLIHAEPTSLSLAALGLHAHEKVVFPRDRARTRAAQNAEIDIAIGLYRAGLPTRWGVTD